MTKEAQGQTWNMERCHHCCPVLARVTVSRAASRCVDVVAATNTAPNGVETPVPQLPAPRGLVGHVLPSLRLSPLEPMG